MALHWCHFAVGEPDYTEVCFNTLECRVHFYHIALLFYQRGCLLPGILWWFAFGLDLVLTTVDGAGTQHCLVLWGLGRTKWWVNPARPLLREQLSWHRLSCGKLVPVLHYMNLRGASRAAQGGGQMFKLIYKGRAGESGFKCAIYPLCVICVILKRPCHFWLIRTTFRLFFPIRSLWLRFACLPLSENSGK